MWTSGASETIGLSPMVGLLPKPQCFRKHHRTQYRTDREADNDALKHRGISSSAVNRRHVMFAIGDGREIMFADIGDGAFHNPFEIGGRSLGTFYLYRFSA